MAEESDKRALPIIGDIVNKHNAKIAPVNQFLFKQPLNYMKGTNETTQKFEVNENCISCGICQNVCPANNITLQGKKPVFAHQYERCVACIQYCPKQAINYMDKTQNRGRYKHPQISTKEIADYYKS